ncbi:MAG TPA: hypothetical protein VGB36_10580 [Gammaproteobacteria bacterium]
MAFYLTKAIAALVLPPGGNIVLALLGVLLLVRHRATGVSLLLVAFLRNLCRDLHGGFRCAQPTLQDRFQAAVFYATPGETH